MAVALHSYRLSLVLYCIEASQALYIWRFLFLYVPLIGPFVGHKTVAACLSDTGLQQ